MFKDVVRSTPLTSTEANDYFSNINGGHFKSDVSFLTTLRALVGPRIPKDESVFLSFSDSGYSVNDVNSVSTGRLMSAVISKTYFGDYDGTQGYRGVIQVHSFRSGVQDDNYACFEVFKSSFTNKYTGWEMMEKVTEFYRKKFRVICFIHPENKSVLLLVENLDIRKLHYLQCAIFAFMPWYFNPEDGVTPLEMELINSLREKTSEAFYDVVGRIARGFDFRTEAIKKKLAGFELRYVRIERDAVANEISDCIDQINYLNNEIATYVHSKKDKEIRLLGLDAKLNSGDVEESELMDYFLCNKKLSLFNVTDREMEFACQDYLTFFDEDMAQAAIDNPNSYVYKPSNRDLRSVICPDDIKLLMNAIFIDQTVRIKFCAAYNFRLDGNVRAISRYDYGYEFSDCMPNPHTDKYSCMGNYQRMINEILQRNDYIGAIEQCIASCKSLNFGDGIVMGRFMEILYGEDSSSNDKCIELPTGKVVRAREAIAWLKAQEEEENNEQSN